MIVVDDYYNNDDDDDVFKNDYDYNGYEVFGDYE